MEGAAVLGGVSLVALAGGVGCLLQLHRRAPEVSAVRDAVSDYGAGPHEGWYRAQVTLLGLAAIAIWVGLRSAELDGDGSVWLLVFAVSRVLIARFPVDLPGAQRTRTGRIHNLLAATAFTSIAIASSTLSGWLTDTPAWAFNASWYRWSGLGVAVIAVALAVIWLVPALRGAAFGLVERCWYVATILWLAITAVGLIIG